MRLAQGPRPLPIRLFALLLLTQAIADCAEQMMHLADVEAMLATRLPQFAVSRDGAIISACVRLTIALVPVALVWLWASRLARWLVLVLAMGKLVMAPHNIALMAPDEPLSPLWLASLLLSLVGAALLFTPGASRWFARRGRTLTPQLE